MKQQEIFDFFDKAETFWLATADGRQPHVRPLSFKMMIGEKLYFGVGEFKDVYKQIAANPHIELTANAGPDIWRYYGEVVFDKDPSLMEKVFELMPSLKEVYGEGTGNKMGMFYLKNAKVETGDWMDYSLKKTVDVEG